MSLDPIGSKSEQQSLSAPVSWSKPQYSGGFVLLKSEKKKVGNQKFIVPAYASTLVLWKEHT